MIHVHNSGQPNIPQPPAAGAPHLWWWIGWKSEDGRRGQFGEPGTLEDTEAKAAQLNEMSQGNPAFFPQKYP